MTTLTLEQLENMSDEDFAKVNFSDLPDDETPVSTEVETTSEEVPNTETRQPTEQVGQEVPEQTQEVEHEAEQPSDAVPNGAASEAEQSQAGTEQNEGGEAKPVTQEEVTAEKAFFDRVTAEFQANGKAFKIDSAEDVVSLMQKGLNYNQKMATMKPGMKVLKAL